MRKIYFTAILGMFMWQCSQPESPFQQILKSTKEYQNKIDVFAEKQAQETEPDKMFAYDDSIAAVKNTSDSLISSIFENSQQFSINYKQTNNTNLVKIESLKITSAKHNEFSIEATVSALENSATTTPYISISAFNATGTRLDISGGISYEGKLESGKQYTFTGEVKNTSQLVDGCVFDFDEKIKKW